MRLEQDVIAIKSKTESLDVLQGRVSTLEKSLESEKGKKDRTDIWFQRATWAVVIAGVIKFAFF